VGNRLEKSGNYLLKRWDIPALNDPTSRIRNIAIPAAIRLILV